MRFRTLKALVFLSSILGGSMALAQPPGPPPGWGKPKPLPAANGTGTVSFVHGGTPFTLPLNQIEITVKNDLYTVSLAYVDAAQENKLNLAFGSMPKLGKNDPHPITGFLVRTKAHGQSKSSANKTKCDLVIARLTEQEVSGTLTCTGMTDLSAENAAPDVTAVKFDGKIK